VQFQEITENQWNMMESHLPPPAKTGRPRSDDRTTIHGILFVLVTGCRWTELPVRYGSKSTAHRRFQNLQQKRVWQKILSSAIKSSHKQGKMQLQEISIDSSSVPAKKAVT
jgi:transposase